MKLDGQLERAQLENLSSASPTPTPTGRIYIDTSSARAVARIYTGAAWETFQMRTWAYANKTAAYTVLSTDDYLYGDDSGASFTFTLPAAATVPGQTFWFAKTNSSKNVITIDGDGAEQIDGLTTYELREQHEWVCIQSQGTLWKTVASARPFAAAQSYTASATIRTGFSLCDASGGAIVATLPTAASMVGRTLYVKKTDTSFLTVTITAAGAETIDGANTLVLNTYKEWVRIYSNGTSWVLLDWGFYTGKVAYTPTGAWVANVTYTGFWWRVGDRINIQVKCTCSGAPSGTFTANLPTNVAIDTTKFTSAVDAQTVLDGSGVIFDTSTNDLYMLTLNYSTTVSVKPKYMPAASVGKLSAFTQAAPMTFATGDVVEFTALNLPATGWRG